MPVKNQPQTPQMRKRNAAYSKKVRDGKAPSSIAKDKKSGGAPLSHVALAVVMFSLLGGIVFELLKFIF